MSFTHGHALIIGIGSYQDTSIKDVPTTSADAQALADVLRDANYCGYPQNQVTLLSNSNATRDSILSALDELTKRTNPEDTVLLFYSGHGENGDNNIYHLTTHDTQFEQSSVKTATAISQTELLDKLRLIPAKRLVILINACHAGEISPTLGSEQQSFITGNPLPQQTIDALLSTGSGRIIITACRSGQASYIGHGQLTLFGQALTDGLRGQAFSGRAGYISVFDLYTHLYFAIEEEVERLIPAPLRQGKNMQEPELTILKGVGPYPIALYRGSQTLGDFPTDHLPPKETTPRQVNPARLRHFAQPNSGAGAVNVNGSLTNSPITTGTNNTVTTSGRDTLHAGGNIIHVIGNYIESNINKSEEVRGHTHQDKVQNQKRSFEAAMPEVGQVGRPTEVRVMIAMEQSQGLRAFLPDYTKSGELIKSTDVEAHSIYWDFPEGAHYVSGNIVLEAPDFIIPNPSLLLKIPKDQDTGVASFALTPKQENKYSRVIVKLFNKDELIDTLTLTSDIGREQLSLKDVLWKLITSSINMSQNISHHDNSQTIHNQTISGNAHVGVAVSGDVHGPITYQSGVVPSEGGSTHTGDKVAGDKVAGDKVMGDQYKENSMSNDTFNMSGNFSGSILNIESTLSNVSLLIGAAQHVDNTRKTELQNLLAQLTAELQKVPAEQSSEAKVVAEIAKTTVEQAIKEQPNKTLLNIRAEGLKLAASDLAAVLPTVLPIARQIAETVMKLVS
jgi:hypothetical protein